MSYEPLGVLCQGEFVTVFRIVTKLKAAGVKVYAACSERNVKEELVDGKSVKKVIFEFKGFREY